MDDILIVKYFCYKCNKEIDILNDHRCTLCDSSFIEELSKATDATNRTTGEGNSTKINNLDQNSENVKDCSICLTQMVADSDEPLVILKCEHNYHKKCIKSWFNQSNSCPLCRVRVDVSRYASPKRNTLRPLPHRLPVRTNSWRNWNPY